jgi:multiple sugar transport system ATP-binding protein
VFGASALGERAVNIPTFCIPTEDLSVVVRGLTKRFGGVTAVDNVSFEVKEGEFLVLLGPSGSGKTTTLRCIAGLEEIDDGEVYIGGKKMNDLPPSERDVAMVFQSYALYPYMTVYDNIAFPLKIRKVTAEEVDARVKEVAELLRIGHLLKRKPKQLSGGEQQRVAVGRAIVRRPKVFLMDEPLSNLDAKLRLYMRAELKKLQKDLKIKTIYVTHDQAEAMTMADRVAVFDKGRILQIDSPQRLYDNPANAFVAGFVGAPAMNLITCSLAEAGDGIYCENSLFRYHLPDPLAQAVRASGLKGKATLGVRPEDVLLVPDGTEGSFKCAIFVVEPLGSEMIIDIKVDDVLMKVKEQRNTRLEAGEQVSLAFRPGSVHIFDPASGKAVF